MDFHSFHKTTAYCLVRAETEALYSQSRFWKLPWDLCGVSLGTGLPGLSVSNRLLNLVSPRFAHERKGVPETTWTNSQFHCFSLGTAGRSGWHSTSQGSAGEQRARE